MSDDGNRRTGGVRRGQAGPLIGLAATLVVLGQLRHLELTSDGGMVWTLSLGLVLAGLGLLNLVVWMLYREVRRLQDERELEARTRR